MERSILVRLDWELRGGCPLFFLARFQRLLDFDREAESPTSLIVGLLARSILRRSLEHGFFLRFTAAENAAAALLHSIHSYRVVKKPDPSSEEQQLEEWWTRDVAKLTQLSLKDHVLPCFKAMQQCADDLNGCNDATSSS